MSISWRSDFIWRSDFMIAIQSWSRQGRRSAGACVALVVDLALSHTKCIVEEAGPPGCIRAISG